MSASVFIVDDEQPTIDGVGASIRNFLPELAIAGSARSGREAVDAIARLKPDIALMDVRMPGLSGLDALREIRVVSPGTLAILLTAYERFDVAKEAFALGVHDYLVKPVEQETLIACLRGALAKVERRAEDLRSGARAKEALASLAPALAEAFALAAAQGRFRLASALAPESFRSASLATMAAVAVTRPDGSRAAPTPEEAAALARELSYRCDCCVGSALLSAIPVAFPGDTLPDLREPLARAFGPDRVVAWAAGHALPLERAEESWALALARIAGVPDGAEGGAARLDASIAAARSGDGIKATAEFAAFVEGIPRSIPEGAFARCISSALSSMAAVAAGCGPGAWALAEAVRVDADGPRDLVAASARRDAAALVDLATRPRPASRVIRAALDYVHAYYRSPISLEEVAEAAAASPGHLSREFSQELGVSFVEYLTRLRLGRAKSALLEGKLSVKEIAVDSGYSDPNYFSRIFRRYEGMSPSEYAQSAGGRIT
jgi:two-component system response regulator YesN